ncbi:hypothetical protein [Enterococcus sp. DIV2324]|uniref:hypothetical protein n=1 Tax=Enterococcus sp. DIV2324 TaxID=2774763 RepID=UPI003F219374
MQLKKREKFLIAIIVLTVFGMVFSYYYLPRSSQKDTKKIEALQKENQLLKQKESDVVETNQQLTDQLDTLNTEKNGTANDALTDSARDLFSTAFDYCTERKEDSVKNRKEKALKIATEKAVDGLFPKDAASGNPSVKTTSRLKGDPEVYLMPSNDKQLTALVIVHYAVSIADSEDQTGSFMYKVKYDSTENRFTSIENAGVVTIK